jgi:hypothetical protein
MWALYVLVGLAIAMIVIGGLRRANGTLAKIIEEEVSNPCN